MLIYDGAIGVLGSAADTGSARALELAVEAKIPGYDPLAVAGLPRPRSAAGRHGDSLPLPPGSSRTAAAAPANQPR